MGGVPPLGYDVRDRRLSINESEAMSVKLIYKHYLELGWVRLLRKSSNGEESFRKYACRKRELDLADAGSRGEPYTSCWPTRSISGDSPPAGTSSGAA